MTHKATPEQWDDAGAFASDTRACLLELRDRIAALEAAANITPTSNQRQVRSSAEGAPAAGLVEREVARFASEGLTGDDATPTARAAILAVADWLESQGVGAGLAAARWLREEVERG